MYSHHIEGEKRSFEARSQIESYVEAEWVELKKSCSNFRFYRDSFKPALDFVAALFFLIIFSPLIGFIALGIKLTSRGPVFFKHTRAGQASVPFTMYKFRTMYTEVSGDALKPNNPNDQRITRIGKYLRMTSMDELPQLINVLKGEMSLVGPRPEMLFIVNQYEEWQKLRLIVKPGITGLWQLSPDRKYPIHEGIHHDFEYIKKQSFLLDLKILLKTPIVLIRPNTC